MKPKKLKRCRIILLTLCAVFALSACSSSSESSGSSAGLSDEQQQLILSGVVTTTQTLDDAVGTETEEQISQDDVFGPALESWKNSLDDIGEVEGITEGEIEETDDGITASAVVEGSDHDAEVVYTIDPEEGSISSVAVNVDYSIPELLQQAGLNTVLGMGTTFVILILLSLIISCFRIIPKIQAKRRNREQALYQDIHEKERAQALADESSPTGEDVSNDLELIAVIMAAVAASEGRSGTDGLVVRSIRRRRRG